jgi:spore maturation protein SpmB
MFERYLHRCLIAVTLILSILYPWGQAAADTSHCGEISMDETWSAADNVHIIECNVFVNPGVTLTISEGSIVKFQIGTSLIIDGSLRIEGSEMDPVHLTSILDDSIGGDTNGDGNATSPSPGDWVSIHFRHTSDGANSIIDHAFIRYAGYGSAGNVTLTSASPTIQNSQLTDGIFAIWANLASFPILSGNTYADNQFNALALDGGTIGADATWDVTDVSYLIWEPVFVGVGKTLTVLPDVVVKFNDLQHLTIDGSLQVLGTGIEPVYFTSMHDDSIGGDTNGNGSATTPSPANWASIHFRQTSDGANSIIDHAFIRYAGYGSAGNVTLTSASPTIQNSQLTDGVFAIWANLASFPILSGNTYVNNQFNALALDGGTIGADATWDVTDVSYLIWEPVFVGVGKTLTVLPGVVVKFNDLQHLTIDGSLQVLGTGIEPVYFTSMHDDSIGGDTNGNGSATTPSPANWASIHFRQTSDGANSIIDHAFLRYAGYGSTGNVTLTSASPTIQNSQLTDGVFAIWANLASFPILSGNTYVNNQFNALALDGGTIGADATWDVTDVSYLIWEPVFVGVGKTLTVLPGVVVKFNDLQHLTIDGSLQVLGTGIEPVYFTSMHDDSIGGDTNGNGSATTPSPANWASIHFRQTSDGANSIIDHAFIRYAGYGSAGNVTLTFASPTIQNSQLTDGLYGLLATSSTPYMVCNNIYNNVAGGLQNQTIMTIINATEQWWGSPDGPHHPVTNPTGSGNQVSDGVLYSPWLTAPCGTSPYYSNYLFLPMIRR